MSMAPLGGLVGSASGAPLSQTRGSEAERAQKDSLAQQRQTETAEQAERAAGIGETDKDAETSERDADGRRLWEPPADAAKEAAPADPTVAPSRQSKDATGLSGNRLDLTG